MARKFGPDHGRDNDGPLDLMRHYSIPIRRETSLYLQLAFMGELP
jgi:hypothetical protein